MNNEKYDDWFNEVFDQAFERAANTPSPVSNDTKRDSWLQVKQQLALKNKRKQSRRRFQLAAVIAASMAMGAIIFSPPAVTQAVSPIYQQIKEWGDGFVTIISGKKTPSSGTVAKTSPPIDDAEEVGNLGEKLLWSSSSGDYDFTLEEVKSKLTFPYPEFAYLPNDYQYNDVIVAPKDDKAPIDQMTIQYISSDSKLLNILYIDLEGDIAVSTVGSPDSKTLHLKSGTEAIYSEIFSKTHTLQFTHNNVLIQIFGEDISKNELLKIANSLK